MIWESPFSDYYRWRHRFALLPKRIGERRIWLEQYAFRYLHADEYTVGAEWWRIPTLLPGVFTEWREYALRDGYMVWRKRRYCGSIYSTSWYRPKVKLEVVV